MGRTIRAAVVFVLAVSAGGVAFSQQAPVAYTDDFQSYGTQANPAGWIDTSIGNNKPQADGLYKTWPDPLQPGNVVYGTKQSSGKPEGSNPRIGTFSTYAAKQFSATGRFEYRGRFLRTNADARIGLTFLSAYPEIDRYYLIGLWSNAGSAELTMQLFGFGAGAFTGTTNSGATIATNHWYRFLIQVDNANNATRVRARFWPDGTTEPSTFSIDAADAAASRLTSGRIGLWAADKGDAYIDDVAAKSPVDVVVVDTTPPVITFVEGSTTLAPNALTKFGRGIHVGITATDASGIASLTATLDGQPYTPLATIAADGRHTIRAHAVDTAGNAADAQTDVLIDQTAPVVVITENGQPFLTGLVVRRNVTPQITVTDLTSTTIAAQLTVNATTQSYTFGTPIIAEGSYTLTATVTDEFGRFTTIAPIAFTIDKTAPALAFTVPAANAVLATRQVVVSGTAGDAVSVTVNGTAAVIGAAGAFVTPPLDLDEGLNTLTAVAVDRAGNTATIAISIRLDTRAPEVTIASPAANACLNATQVTVAGTVGDDTLIEVKVSAGATPVVATLSADRRAFTVTVPATTEGKLVLRVDATDTTGHVSTVLVPVTIDRTKPAVEVTEGGQAFIATLLNRPVSLFARANDADAAAAVTLDGQPYAGGTAIGEGAHELRAKATDCAGNTSDELVLRFTIDRTPPSLLSVTPANGAAIAQKPALSGVLSEPATLVEERSGRAAVMSGASFTLNSVLQEGLNTLSLLATDAAGNEARIAYTVTVDTTAPTLEITENGSPIPADALFARAVTPVLQSSDAAATITATINGAPFASGTTLSADGSYAIAATAHDALGNISASATATFRIERTPPGVTITAPAAHALVADSVDVRGTVTGGDVVAVTVNGVAATLTGAAFAATVRLELDTNIITVVATDRAGNAASASVEVDRDRGAPAIILTSPANGTLTNRPTIIVAGQVLTPASARSLTINGAPLPFDAAGTFRRNDFPLVEGDNVITAAVSSGNSATSSVRVTVTADFTPPMLEVRANAAALENGARFAASPSLTLFVTENSATPPTQTLTVDGEVVAPGTTSLANGGHALTALARDAAGNETRVERVFFIGEAASVSGCGLSSFEPAGGTSVFSEMIHVTGRSGGAAGVLINGHAAAVADGSFCGDAALALGRNEVTIQCADAAGHATTDAPVVLVIHRYGNPQIAITSPTTGASLTTNKVTVSGTVSAGVVSGDVNGIAFPVSGTGTFTVPDIPVTPGLNVLIARAKTSSARGAATSVIVRGAGGTPQLAITSPLTGTETGAQTTDVSGTWTNIDPSTLAVSVGAATVPATVTALNDTTGTFVAHGLPLAPGVVTTLRASARTATGTQVAASAEVRQVTTAPSIVITAPADNSYFAPARSGPLQVTGTIAADAGSQVQVNGVSATLTGASFTADVDISAAPSGITPVIARVITPDSRQGTDSVRVIRLLAPLAVKESFPAADAVGVDPGVALVVLFTSLVDKSSAAALHVTDAAGAPIAGEVFVDRDAITFAPAQPLRNGQRYTVTIDASLKDAAGAPMTAAHSFSFSVAATAASAAPILDETPTSGCFSGTTITGRVSTPGARVRLDVDGVTMNAVSFDTGAFRFTFTFSGQAGYHLVRVREIGTDGTLSAERALCFRLNCAVPQVVSASLDRTAKTLSIQFSKPMDASSLSVPGTILITPEGESALTGTLTLNATNDVATIALATLPQKTITLTVTKAAKDAAGATLAADYSETFAFNTDPALNRGDGYITGTIYDATNGRPLPSASLSILNSQFSILNSPTGHYARSLPEGAYTLQASARDYTTVWRQVVVPAGAGVVPIDIRLTKRGPPNTTLTLTHGGDTKVTKPIELQLAAGSLAAPNHARLTSISAQALAGLLPLGWSPLAAAEIVLDDNSTALPGAKLTFIIDAAAVNTAAQTLSLVQYDSERDEWRVVVPAANVGSGACTEQSECGRVAFDVTTAGNYALVYPDRSANLIAHAGASLPSAPNPCVTTPDVCRVVSRSFTLDPNAVLPSGRTVATLTTDGAKAYPSGTAVQAFIDEHLNLADGRVLVDPPFATDLLIYRTLAGDAGVADFHLSPSAQASGVILRDGVDHIRIVNYPGRIDRGTLIGAEGGRVPGDSGVTIDVPAGATSEPLHASTASIGASDLAAFGPIAGFHIAGGFTLSLTRTSEPQLPDGMSPAAVELLTPARATVAVPQSLSPQVVIAEVLSSSPYGTMVRLVALTSTVTSLDLPGVRVVSTRPIVSTQLPLDGIVRPGQYLVLVADAPIAYAYGQLRLANALAAVNARVSTPSLGIRDLTRTDGLFVLPVPSKSAAPFTLVPRSQATGDGAAFVAAAAPDADAFVNVGPIALATQPPRLQSVAPAEGAQVDAGALVVQAVFDVAIDAASIAGGIRVTDVTMNASVAGRVSLNGTSIVRFTPAQPLRPGSRFTITIVPTIRSAAGAAFAQTVTSQFTTRALATNASIRPERVRITIPDAAGKSAIIGSPGALPGGAIALAVRRGTFFIDSYTATAAADGSFSFDAGHRDAADRITTADAIDLDVLDPVSRALIAVIPLTPFATADGRGFLAAPDRQTRFTSIDGIVVTVPAGAFDVATIVNVAPAQQSAFADVPKFDAELGYATSFEITFDGVAKKVLDVSVPVPAGFDPANRDWLLGYLGDSVRGPRVMIVDVMHVEGGMFKSGLAPSSTGVRRIATNAAIFGEDLQKYLAKVRRSGIHAVVNLSVAGAGLAAGFIQGLQASLDLFWDTMESLYAAHFYVADNEGLIVIPVVTGKPFTIAGVDAGTGLEAFSKTYAPIAPTDPGAAVAIDNPYPGRVGPFPVFGSPFRIETLDVDVADTPLRSVRDFTVTLAGGTITALSTLAPDVRVAMLNPTNGEMDWSRAGGLSVRGAVGDRIVLYVEERDVDPDSTLSIVFSDPLAFPSDDAGAIEQYLRDLIVLQTRPASTAQTAGEFLPISGALHLRVDSGGRRVLIDTPASLHRGNQYRLAISNALTGRSGLHLGEARDAAGATIHERLGGSLYLDFTVRAPGGQRASFDIASGAIRDQALNGNVLFVTALEGGVLAYDVSNPAALGANSRPLGHVAGNVTSQWAIATDHHGRVYTTGLGSLFGTIQSFRLEDFLPAAPGDPTRDVPVHASAIVSFAPGASASLAIDSRIIAGDRPEAIPRKLQILLQDDEQAYDTRAAFKTAVSATVTSTAGDLEKFDVDLTRDADLSYATQRITVENTTLDLRWSADATLDAPAHITGIIAAATDRLRVIRNRATYGVVSLFGYGVGVFDLNAMESNDWPALPESFGRIREKVRLTDGKMPGDCDPLAVDAIPDLTFTPDAAIVMRAGSSDLHVFALDANRGVLDLVIQPPTGADADNTRCDERAPNGLRFRNRYFIPGDPTPHVYDDPRLLKLRTLFAQRTGREPNARFTGASTYHWTLEAKDNRVTTTANVTPSLGARGSEPGTAVARDYLLIPGNDYGLLVVEVDGNPPPPTFPSYTPLTPMHLVDVIWIPGGAYAVRAIPRTSLATVVDGEGHILLVDLARLDERWTDRGPLAADALFPTVAGLLANDVDTPDPRVVWKSPTALANGTLAPVIDPDTGFLYIGKLLEKTTNVVAAIDPRIRLKADLGGANGLSEVGGVVPLGIAPPAGVLRCDPAQPGCNASLAAFRLEIALPGALTTSAGDKLFVALESERVFGAVTEQTAAPYPVSHLRRTTRGGANDPRADERFVFTRAVPASLAPALRYQRGFNKWISPWVVAIADPRASVRYTWPAGSDRAAQGCASCDRPPTLRGRDESSGVFELLTNGRLIAARTESALFAGTGYDYLGDGNRLTARFATVMSDTVRPPSVLVAAQNPPIAGGMLQETTYLHSGELETSNVDLDAGGRAGWNATFDRTYRSRTMGGTAIGQGWESSMFRRLRELPNGDIEYRDGAGELWLYTVDKAGGAYKRPRGLFLNLTRTDRGFLLVSQKKQIAAFDAMGRLVHESDEFATNAYAVDEGNVVRYLYDASGRLAQVVDPVGRTSVLGYFGDEAGAKAGMLQSITDWRGRVVDYDYDASGRLTAASLPRVSGKRPRITYGYASAASTLNDTLELAPNLATITDPIGGNPRVTFVYGSGADRDKVTSQRWATGESATFSYAAGTATTVDALGQSRNYTLTANATNFAADRAHVHQVDELGVETSTYPFGELPTSATAASVPRAPRTRTFVFGYEGDGLLLASTLAGVRTTTATWKSVEPGMPGSILQSETTGAASAASAGSVATSSLPGAITRRYGYDGAFLTSIQADEGGVALQPLNFAALHGATRSSTATNDAITAAAEVDRFGRPTKYAGTGGTDAASAGTQVILHYDADAGAPYARGLVTSVDRAGLVSAIRYPDANTIVVTDDRKVETTTELDEWLRPKHTFTSTAGLQADQSATYDENGRVVEVKRKQSDARTVTETFDYDALGRLKKSTSDNVAVGEALTTTESSVAYDLPNRKVTRTLPGGAVVTELLDGLGRVTTRLTQTGIGELREELVYDLAGNVVYAADNHLAEAAVFDLHGRAVGALSPDGTKTVSRYDALGQPTLVQQLDAAGAVIAETKPTFTSSGRLASMETKIDETEARKTETKWDGAGRSTLVATAGRALRQRFSQNGRLEESVAGAGTLAGITTAFQSVTATGFDGPLLTGAAIAEKGSVPIAASYGYDTLVHPTRQQVGSLAWEQRFDADGNVAAAKSPARPETTFAYDAIGNVTAETKPGGAMIYHGYAASGAHESYRDPADEVTATTTDRIGRPLVRTYIDGTTETYTYDGERVAATTDRQGRTFSSTYNDKGQLIELRAGGGELLEKYGYDAAGRLEKWTTRDAELRYENFDLEGRPRHTRQIRFAERSGFTTAAVLDEYAQDHEWNVHGERKAWTMPLPAGFAAPGWTRRVEEEHDAAGNVTTIQRTLTGSTALVPLMSADYRGAGRPNVRTITTTSGSAIARNYGYDASTGQLNDLTVTAGGLIVAGSRIEYDGTQIAKATLHGVSNETRANQYGYDDRSRLASSTAARTNGTSALAIEHVDHADFRTSLERTDSGPQSLPSLAFVQQPGHKIAQLARNGSSRTFSYGGGAERVDDGRFVYELDARGRLIATTEKPLSSSASTRRIQYFYSPADRVIGRRAEYKPAPAAAWQLEDRAAVLSDDGLPAEETFVWDPVTDTLVTVATLNGEPLRQIIHGGNTYDDPIEVAVAEAGTVHRLHPVFDEAGAGTLQVILNQQGQVVSRTIEEGAYGEDEFGLAGPAVDRIAIAATKDAAGVLQTVTVSIRTTEQLAPATIAAGARLTVLDATGAVIRSSTATPALFDNYTLRWTLPAAAWTTLTSPAGDPKKLSIAVTNTLRAVTWDATQPILPAPQWATSSSGTMYSTPALPVEYRQPLSDLTTWLSTTTAEKVLFEAPALSTLAGHSTPAARLIVVAGFQALPFQEPATGLVFARGRWYEPQTGTFLTPDPLGYKDSSNLYAFAGGDPVNGRDPTGTSAAPLRDGGAYIRNVKTDARYKISRRQAEEDPVALQDLLMIEGGLSAQEAKDFLQDIGLTYTHSYQRPVVRPDLPKGDNWIKNAIIATSGLPAQNRQQEIVQGGLQIVSSVAIIGATNAYRRTVTARPEMGVGPYQYGRAGDLKARSFPRDGLDIDHQPSTASLLARAEAELGRPLTPAEIQQIMADGMAVAVPVEWHRGKSRTYGGRNKPEKISADAADPANAATLDSQAMIEGAMPAKRQVAREAADAVRKRAAGQ